MTTRIWGTTVGQTGEISPEERISDWVADWRQWQELRDQNVRSEHGSLSLTGTHWLDDDGLIPDVPGKWLVEDGSVVVHADLADGLTVDGTPVAGKFGPLRPDTVESPSEIFLGGDVELLVIEREGLYAVRVYDPQAKARADFQGIDAFAPDPAWVLEGAFRPYEEQHHVSVLNADGKERDMALDGTVYFEHEGVEHSMHAAAGGGVLFVTFADETCDKTTYRFRFLVIPGPDAEGKVTIDFNRAYLPPCAFSPHFICAFPPPGNRLPFTVTAGEKLPR